MNTVHVLHQQGLAHTQIARLVGKGKGKPSSPYSIAERRVLELIPVLGSQPADDVSHEPGGRLPSRPGGFHIHNTCIHTDHHCITAIIQVIHTVATGRITATAQIDPLYLQGGVNVHPHLMKVPL